MFADSKGQVRVRQAGDIVAGLVDGEVAIFLDQFIVLQVLRARRASVTRAPVILRVRVMDHAIPRALLLKAQNKLMRESQSWPVQTKALLSRGFVRPKHW